MRTTRRPRRRTPKTKPIPAGRRATTVETRADRRGRARRSPHARRRRAPSPRSSSSRPRRRSVAAGHGSSAIVLLARDPARHRLLRRRAYAKDYARDYIKQRIVAVLGIEDTPGDGRHRQRVGAVPGARGKLEHGRCHGRRSRSAPSRAPRRSTPRGAPRRERRRPTRSTSRSRCAEDESHRRSPATSAGSASTRSRSKNPRSSARPRSPLFGFGIPVGMGIEPSADEGRSSSPRPPSGSATRTTRPTSCGDQSATSPSSCSQQQSLCVNEILPIALTIIDVDVVEKDLVLEINGEVSHSAARISPRREPARRRERVPARSIPIAAGVYAADGALRRVRSGAPAVVRRDSRLPQLPVVRRDRPRNADGCR